MCDGREMTDARSATKVARACRSAARRWLLPDQWALVEAFGDVQDEIRLAKIMAFDTFGSFGSFGPVPSCCKKHPEGQRSLRAASTPIGLRYGTALAAFVVLLASVISRPSHSQEHPPLPQVVPLQLTMAPLPPPRSLPGGFCCPGARRGTALSGRSGL